MKTFLLTLVACLAASTATAQFQSNPIADKPDDKPASDKDTPPAGDRPQDRNRPFDRTRKLEPAGAAPGAAAGVGANAGVGGVGRPLSNPLFEALDADGDGMITKKELRSAAAKLKALDTDNDGNISLAEASPPGAAGVAPAGALAGPAGQLGDVNQMIEQLMQNDKNGDGKLSADELPGPMAQQLIQNGDKNRDGALSKDELTQAMQAMQAVQNAGGFAGGYPAGPGNYPTGAGGLQNGAAGAAERQLMGQWLRWDTNGDGALSANEVPPQARSMLQDLDGDGRVTPAELRMMIERNGERMRGVRGRGQNDQKPNAGDAEEPEADGKKRDRRRDRDES